MSAVDEASRITYQVKVLRRYPARLSENDPHVTLNFLAGRGHHLVYCGTLTMSEPEWSVLEEHLCSALNDDFEVQVITSQRAAEEPTNL